MTQSDSQENLIRERLALEALADDIAFPDPDVANYVARWLRDEDYPIRADGRVLGIVTTSTDEAFEKRAMRQQTSLTNPSPLLLRARQHVRIDGGHGTRTLAGERAAAKRRTVADEGRAGA